MSPLHCSFVTGTAQLRMLNFGGININNLIFSHLDLMAVNLEIKCYRDAYDEALKLYGHTMTHTSSSEEYKNAFAQLKKLEEGINRYTRWGCFIPARTFPRITYAVDVLEGLIKRLLDWENTVLHRPVQSPPSPPQVYINEDWTEDELLSDVSDRVSYDPPSEYSNEEAELNENWFVFDDLDLSPELDQSPGYVVYVALELELELPELYEEDDADDEDESYEDADDDEDDDEDEDEDDISQIMGLMYLDSRSG